MRQRVTTIVAVAAAVGCVLSVVQPLYSGQTRRSYAQERRVIRAGILVPGGYGFVPSPYSMYLLGSESVYVPLGGRGFEFYPPRPPGWEIINPLATPGIDKSAPGYWRVGLGGIDTPALRNFDLLLLPIIAAPVDLSIHEQRLLERWVDEGGLLWIDNQPGPNDGEDPQLGDFFLRPRVEFAARDRALSAPKVGVDFTHPLLRGRYPLSEDEVQWLGQQHAYGAVGDPTNAGVSPLDGIVNGVNNPFPPNSALTDFTDLQEVVGELYDDPGSGERRRVPVIAAGRYGDGCIVVSACGIAAGISNWWGDLRGGAAQGDTELPQWALPDLKFAYNVIQWWMDWEGTRGRVRFRGDYREELPGPPVLAWDDFIRDPVTAATGSLAGPTAVGRGLAFAGSFAGVLAGWDSEPERDRDLDGQSDDGAPDYALGSARDLLWSAVVPWQDPGDIALGTLPERLPGIPDPTPAELPRSIVGSPALTTTYDGAGPRRLVAVAVRTDDNLDCSLHAYLADPLDGIQTDPVWSATIKRYDHPQAQQDNGLVNSGPVAVDEFLALVTSDSGTLDAPNRDAHLLIYDAAGPLAPDETLLDYPAAHVEIAEGGRAASFANPPAVAQTTGWDEVLLRWEPVQVAVMVGNSLPRPGPAATGRLWVTPLMVRFPAPGWDRRWQLDPSQPDTAANQAVEVWVGDPNAGGAQVPPHMDDDPEQPLNYIRSIVGGQVRIAFTSWSLFGRGQFPLGFSDIYVRYRDTAGAQRVVNQRLHPGFPASLGGYMSEAGFATPCIFEDEIYVGTDAVNAYPSSSSEGRLAAYGMQLDRASGPDWIFVGDRYRGQTPADVGGYFFSSYSFTPAYAQDTLFAVGNYQFLHEDATGENQAPPGGLSGALYALELKASPELVNVGTADPVFPDAIDPLAPRNDGVTPEPWSADPNQVVMPGRAGTAVWISTNVDATSPDYDSPRYAIGQVAGTTINWRIDFLNRIIRLGAGVFGRLACPVWSDLGTPADPSDDRYVPQQVRVRYFSGGALQERLMEVTPLVKWMYIAPDGWEFVSSPVVTNGMVMVAAYDQQAQRYLLLGLRAVPENPASPEPLWAHSPEPEYVEVLATGIPVSAPCSLAVADQGLVWSANLADADGILHGTLARLDTPPTVIADNNRLVAADTGGRAAATQEAVWHLRADMTLGLAGIPIADSYAERTYAPLARPSRVRDLPNGNLLVVDSGVDSVLELDPAGDVVWRYPNDDPDADLGGMTPEGARLLAPSDAHRYYYQELRPGTDFSNTGGLILPTDTVTVEWATTLIADSGNHRVIEVARPLLNGRYRPEVQRAGAACAELVREIAGPTLTDWPTASGGTTKIPAAFTTAERFAGADGTKVEADAAYPYLSANIMCAVGNHPADPLSNDRYARLVEIGISYGTGAQVAASGVLPRLDGTGAPEGINVFRPRISPWAADGAEWLPRDFINIRQADQVVEQDPYTGLPWLRTLVVDDVGVKLIDNETWNDSSVPPDPAGGGYQTPLFEMRGVAPWLPRANPPTDRTPAGDFLTTYEEEIAGGTIPVEVAGLDQVTRKTGWKMLGLGQALADWATQFGDPTDPANPDPQYPPLIQEPHTGFTPAEWEALRVAAWDNLLGYAQATATSGYETNEVAFLPFYAKRQRDGKYLVVNAYPNPYLSAGPLEVMAPTTSEVLEVDPSRPVGQRIVRSWDEALDPPSWNPYPWGHFIVPDPSRSEYPRLRGGAAPLRQPAAVERR